MSLPSGIASISTPFPRARGAAEFVAVKLESILHYLDGYLAVVEHPDYAVALNGLQVQGPDEVGVVAVAVDASEAVIRAAGEVGADLLVVHHGLFWGGLRPLTGPHFRRVRALIDARLGLYSCHLPLDGHAEIGNCVLLARALGLELEGRFGAYQGAPIGWWGRLREAVDADGLLTLVEAAVGGPAHLIPGGPRRIETVGVMTGAGASFVPEAAALGLDAFITGEGPHHTHFDGMELGVHVVFGGHYATETFGVRALGEHLAGRFGLTWHFVDQPTGL
jgi:dinuclear metal center YbgI/SA1388 family protein